MINPVLLGLKRKAAESQFIQQQILITVIPEFLERGLGERRPFRFEFWERLWSSSSAMPAVQGKVALPTHPKRAHTPPCRTE